MGISKQELAAQMESLEAQEKALQRGLAEIAGAKRMCGHLLGKAERAEDQAQKNAAIVAQEAEEANAEKAAAYQSN